MSDTAQPYPAPECPPAPDAVAQGYVSAEVLVSSSKGLKLEDAERLRPVCIALIEDYAPRAPQAVKDEALIRFASYLGDGPPGALKRIDVGSVELEFRQVPPASAMQLCGARSLLTRWKIRRGGVIG